MEATLRAANLQVAAGSINQPPAISPGAFTLTVQTLGRLTHLVFNSGVTGPLSRIDALATDAAREILDVNVLGAFLCARAAIPRMSKAKGGAGGAMVLVSSAMATLGGARALGMEDQLGSLEVGKRADLIVVDLGAPRLHPLYDPVSHLVYATKGSDVRHSVIEGRVVMRDRKVLTLDTAQVLAEAERYHQQVVASLKP